jgi:ABC-2 type transport system ATP-binding protein
MLAAIVHSITEEGRTVVLSSHLLDEVERVADKIIMIHAGRIVLDESMEQIREQHHQFVLRFDQPQSAEPQLPGLLACTGGPLEWSCTCQQDLSTLEAAVTQLNGRMLDCASPSLDHIFVARVKGNTAP